MSPFERLVIMKKVVKPEEIPNPVRPKLPVDKPKITGRGTIYVQVQDKPESRRELLDQEIHRPS